jgi:uncharacterized protein
MIGLGLSWTIVGATLLITFATSAVHSAVGFAFGLLSTPAFLLLFRPKAVVVLTVLLMLVLNSLIIIRDRKAVGFRELRVLAAPVLLGLPVGVTVLAVVRPADLRLIIGGGLVVLASLMLLGWEPPLAGTSLFPIVAGFVGGVLTTSVNFNGPPVALYLASRQLEAWAFRATIAAYLLAAHGCAVVVFVLAGLLTPDVV